MPHEPPIQYQKMIDDGIYLLSIKKPSEAIVIFNKILAEYPDDSQAFRWKSLAQERLSSNYPENDDLKSRSKKSVSINSNKTRKSGGEDVSGIARLDDQLRRGLISQKKYDRMKKNVYKISSQQCESTQRIEKKDQTKKIKEVPKENVSLNSNVTAIILIIVISIAIFSLYPFLFLPDSKVWIEMIYYSIVGILLIGVLVEGWKAVVR